MDQSFMYNGFLVCFMGIINTGRPLFLLPSANSAVLQISHANKSQAKHPLQNICKHGSEKDSSMCLDPRNG